jgi:hypothetical protein
MNGKPKASEHDLSTHSLLVIPEHESWVLVGLDVQEVKLLAILFLSLLFGLGLASSFGVFSIHDFGFCVKI